MHQAHATPNYLISDKGKQFWCRGFKDWCQRKEGRPRFGAIGQHGSIAVGERFIQTLKVECTRSLLVVSLRDKTFRQELVRFTTWYNEHRPHTTLGGRTPEEVYSHQRPANRSPRFEPRAFWPRPAPCALPQVAVRGTAQTGSELPARSPASAPRRRPPCGVGVISGQPRVGAGCPSAPIFCRGVFSALAASDGTSFRAPKACRWCSQAIPGTAHD